VESQKPVVAPDVKVTESTTPEPSTKPESMIVGLEGYCPVQLHDNRKWIPGLQSISTDYREIRYLFSSEAERELFLKNPSEYAPQDLGCDPVLLTSSSKAVTGSIRYGAFFDQRLYLFRTPENRDQFKLNPLKYIKIRSALKADQIEGTRYQ
jgi:YHS domain-containing protein